MTAIGITGTAAYVPPTVVTNDDLARTLATSDEWIRARTGIRTRRWSSCETTSGMAAKAARRLMTDTGGCPQMIVVATSSPDHIQPPTACLVQAELGLSGVPAFDLGAVCSGFVYALVTATSMAATDRSLAPALVVGAERYSRILDPRDRTATVFFGDGAGAVMLGEVPDGYGILSARLTAHGEYADVVGIRAGGTTEPITQEGVGHPVQYFHMHGPRVWEYATTTVPILVKETLVAADLEPGDIDLVVTHQANLRMIEEILRACDVPLERAETTVEKFGNTAAASIPITLDQAVRRGRLKDGDLVLLAGVGGGMTSGCVVMRWHEKPLQQTD
jgi:3-oxoacyl-[acyl-carrier-protein] synthase III